MQGEISMCCDWLGAGDGSMCRAGELAACISDGATPGDDELQKRRRWFPNRCYRRPRAEVRRAHPLECPIAGLGSNGSNEFECWEL